MAEGPEKTKPLHRLAAILAADIAGYSALMVADEAGTVRDLKAHQAVVLPMITEHGGRIIDTAGDGILADRFDALEDIFELQDSVASSVAGVIEPTLQAAEQLRSTQRPTDDLTASVTTSANLYGQVRHVLPALSRRSNLMATMPGTGQFPRTAHKLSR